MSDSPSVSRCGISAYNGNMKYFIMRNDHCYTPEAISSKRGILSSQNLYKKVSNELTLFKIVSGSRQDVHHNYVEGMDDRVVEGERDDRSKNFRSILLDEWDNVRPTSVRVIIKDYEDEVVAWLLFSVTRQDSSQSWFSKSNLIGAFPWNLTSLLDTKFTFFSMFPHQQVRRFFYINREYGKCYGDVGILVVFDGLDWCSFGQSWNGTRFVYPQVMYVPQDWMLGNWNITGKPSKSLEIVGMYNLGLSIYV